MASGSQFFDVSARAGALFSATREPSLRRHAAVAFPAILRITGHSSHCPAAQEVHRTRWPHGTITHARSSSRHTTQSSGSVAAGVMGIVGGASADRAVGCVEDGSGSAVGVGAFGGWGAPTQSMQRRSAAPFLS
eukprot:scaffold19141_cov66-Phaeocystis_antarctica.AAC.1